MAKNSYCKYLMLSALNLKAFRHGCPAGPQTGFLCAEGPATCKQPVLTININFPEFGCVGYQNTGHFKVWRQESRMSPLAARLYQMLRVDRLAGGCRAFLILHQSGSSSHHSGTLYSSRMYNHSKMCLSTWMRRQQLRCFRSPCQYRHDTSWNASFADSSCDLVSASPRLL